LCFEFVFVFEFEFELEFEGVRIGENKEWSKDEDEEDDEDKDEEEDEDKDEEEDEDKDAEEEIQGENEGDEEDEGGTSNAGTIVGSARGVGFVKESIIPGIDPGVVPVFDRIAGRGIERDVTYPFPDPDREAGPEPDGPGSAPGRGIAGRGRLGLFEPTMEFDRERFGSMK
jgi:hypothetical protein